MAGQARRLQEDLEVYRADLDAEEDEGIREIIRGEIVHAERNLDIIDQLTEMFKRWYG